MQERKKIVIMSRECMLGFKTMILHTSEVVYTSFRAGTQRPQSLRYHLKTHQKDLVVFYFYFITNSDME